ncbi:unnamed protein product [Bursaphelenchus xylophilus]|uniref:histone deacetylase n=1 Tax=Bursaphelenchus xylophilus TaxID=6326 RepID=A0A1I7RR98_BURXY|nr:unnamed protein product [Bursaphelenchus xylophilus]CAG9130886.1 unnamed protein product [Bursaphelenchus xylophilus]
MDNDEPSSSINKFDLEQQLAYLSQLNQTPSFTQNTNPSDYLQSLQLLASQINSNNSNSTSRIGNSNQTSLDEPDPPHNAPAPAARDPTSHIRNRRTFSGSGTTISQTTRDRLKTMIATKKQKQSGLNSTTGSAASSEVNLLSQLAAQVNNTPLLSQKTSISNILNGTPQFEPYGAPGMPSAGHSNQLNDFQLRKVNSEPNLKMRLRARLLNKGSSPVTNPPHPYNNVTPGHHKPLQRCDSDSVSTQMELGMKTPQEGSNLLSHAQSISNMASGSNVVFPSPSLPNLSNNFEQLQHDLNTLLMQASFASFLSMPSLIKNNNLNPYNSNAMLESLLEKNVAGSNPLNFRTASQLHMGGYPSLLKQQLRDLVLRRKSLVREEPEEEHLMGAFTQRFSSFSTGASGVKTGIVYDEAMSGHNCVCGDDTNHVEHGGRVSCIYKRLGDCGLLSVCEKVPSKKAPLDLLKLAHSSAHVNFFAASTGNGFRLDGQALEKFVQLPCGGIGVDADTYFNADSSKLAIKLSVGSLVELVTQVAEGKLKNGFACIRPPGHHAEREQAMGFCFFNNVAIAAKYLQRTFPNKRIAILDWDVHHGNGTQLCFETDPNVLYISLHRHDNGNFFPGTGAVVDTGKEAGKGFSVNIPFSGDIMGDPEYLAAWRVIVLPLLDSFRPEFILVSAGFDASRGHPQALGGYELSSKIFGYFTKSLMAYADGKIVLSLEGGYEINSICDAAEDCVKALCGSGGDITELNAESLEKVPNQAAQETIQKVIAVHKKNWPGLTGLQGINMSEMHWQTVSQGLQSLTVRA